MDGGRDACVQQESGTDGMQDKNATLIFEARTQHRLGKRLEESTEGDEGGLKDNGRMMHKPVLF